MNGSEAEKWQRKWCLIKNKHSGWTEIEDSKRQIVYITKCIRSMIWIIYRKCPILHAFAELL